MATQENYIVNDDSAFDSDSTDRAAQIFTVLEAYTLSQIKFKGYRNDVGHTLNAAIYAVDEEGLPTGSSLASGTIDTTTMTATPPGAWYAIAMAGSYSMVKGNQYALLLWITTDNFYWRKDASSPVFYGGMGLYSDDSGSTWASVSEEDYMFEVHSSATDGDAIAIKELYNDVRDSGSRLRETAIFRSQSFTTSGAYTMLGLKLRLKQVSGGSSGQVTVDLYAADGASKPTGPVLDTGTWDISTGVATTYGRMEAITGWSGYALTGATEYCLVMYTDATGDDDVEAYRNIGRYAYQDGKYVYSTDGGSSWIDTFDADFLFEIYGLVSGAAYGLDGAVPGVGGIAFDNNPEVTFQVGYGAGNEATVPGVGGMAAIIDLSSVYPQGILMVPLPRAVYPHPGKDIDDDYDSQFASIKAYTIAPRLLSGTTEDGEDTFVRSEESGIIREGFQEITWTDRAHLLPRVAQELGNIVSAQTFDVELYNAAREDTITISSITNNLGSGITIAPIPAVPFNLAPRENVDAVVTVNPLGDLIIDASYTFHQSTGETYTIYITGTRVVLFPIRPEAPIKEHLIFDTKVLTAIDGSEQRIANRKAPRSMFEMTIKDRRRRMEMLLMDRQAKICAAPAWHEPSFISSPVAIGDYTVNVSTTDYANFYAGGYAIIMQDEYVYDALEIDSMTPTSLTFVSPTSNVYVNNTQVMPLMVAWFNHSVAQAKSIYNEQTFNLRLRVDAVDNDIADASAFNTYDGKVFLDGPNLVDGSKLSETMEKKVLVLDNITGVFQEFSHWDRSKRSSRKGFKTNTRQELWELRQLLHYLKGQQVSFYIPTFTKDLIPNTTLINANSTFTMDNIGYTVNARDRAPKDFFRILLVDGTELTRTVVGSSEVSTAVEQLTVDAPWPYNIEPEDIERIDFLEKVRINVDDIVITHYNALGQTKTIIPIKEVFD